MICVDFMGILGFRTLNPNLKIETPEVKAGS